MSREDSANQLRHVIDYGLVIFRSVSELRPRSPQNRVTSGFAKFGLLSLHAVCGKFSIQRIVLVESRLTSGSVVRQTISMDLKIGSRLQPNLVIPARAQWVVATLLIGSVLLWTAHTYAAENDSVGKAYTTQATEVARRVVLAELVKHPERIHQMSMKCTFQVDKHGHPHNVKVVSSTHNRWAEDTARRALGDAKFPPLPKSLIEQSGSDLANIEYQIDLNEPR